MATSCPTSVRELYDRIAAEGHRIVPTRGHPRVLRPNGAFLMCLPATPSSSSVRNSWKRYQRLTTGVG
jgi:hypothetical protein